MEHLYVSTKHSADLFQLLSKDLQLPIVWEYQSWGNFQSGGISLGNIVLEVIEANGNQTEPNFGVALEADVDIESSLFTLNSLSIPHGRISNARSWSNLSILGKHSDDLNLFICDYHDRARVQKQRGRAARTLIDRDGGTLGLLKVKEVIISHKEADKLTSELERLPQIERKKHQLIFPEGPPLLFQPGSPTKMTLDFEVKNLTVLQDRLHQLGLNSFRINQQVILENKQIPIHFLFEEQK